MIQAYRESPEGRSTTVRCDVLQTDAHVYLTVWIGSDADHLAQAGRLCCRSEEWDALRSGLCTMAITGESLGRPV